MIANCRSVVSDCIKSGNDGRAFRKIRLDRSLPHVASVNQQYRPAIIRPRLTQIAYIAGKQCQTPIAVDRQQGAMHVVGAEDGKRNHRVLIVRRLTADSQQQDRDDESAVNAKSLQY